MSNIHPLLVHIPIALLSMSFLFDCLSLLLKRQEFERTAWWTMLVGTIGLAASVVSGLLAEQSVTIQELAREHFETHQQIAFVIAGLYSVLLLWRIGCKTELPKQKEWFFVGISLFGVVLLWIGAWYGGELVFRFGVGVQQ